MNGPFGNRFPYTNFHEMNLDWVIQIAKDFLDQYSHIQEIIEQGEADIDEKASEALEALAAKETELEGLLDAWYTEHSGDIADALADALADLNEWYTTHENYLDAELAANIAEFNETATAKAAEVIESIPDDYTALAAEVQSFYQDYPSVLGLLDETLSVTFGSASQTVTTTFLLTEGVTYQLYCDDSYTGYINFYATGDTDHIARIYSKTPVYFTAYTSAAAKVFNGNSNKTGTATITVAPYMVHAALSKNPVMIGNNSALSTLTGGTNSVNDFPVNKIVTISSSSVTNLTNFPDTLTSTGEGVYISFDGRGAQFTNGIAQLFIGDNGSATRWKVAGSWTEWRTSALNYKQYNNNAAFFADFPSGLLADIPRDKIICIGSSSIAATDKPVPDFVGNVITYSAKVSLRPGATQLAFDIYRNDMFIRSYIYDAGGNYWTHWMSSRENAAVFTVGSGLTYESLTSLLIDIKDVTYNKIIYIQPGEYDIFAEYLAEVSDGRLTVPSDDITPSDYFYPYNAFVPNNTKIIGLGNVSLVMSPDASDVTLGESHAWSPLNVLGSVEIENLTVIGHNCRYCLHNDDHNANPGAKQIYRNCRFLYTFSDLKDGNRLGYNIAVGFGIQKGATHIFEDCEIYTDTPGNQSAYYGHDGSSYSNGKIILRNCNIHSSNFSNDRVIRLQSISETQGLIDVRIENCYLNGGLTLDIYTSDALQNFNTTLINTNKVPVSRDIPSGTITDIYPVTWYNPLPTPTNADQQIYVDELT